jgi:ATP:corrinoid adenosyltransferase
MAASLATDETNASPSTETTPPVDAEPTPTETPTTETDKSTATVTEPNDTEEELTSEDEADFISYVRSQFGEDLSGKYKDPEEAVKGLVEAYRTVGRRDEDASYGRALRELIQGREQDVAAYLSGQQKPTEPAAGKRKTSERELEDFPPDADNWQYQLVEKDGAYSPATGAGFTIAEYNAYNRALQKRVQQMAREFPDLKAIPDKVKRDIGQLQGSAEQQLERQAIKETLNRYGKAIFIDGDQSGPLTAEGQRINGACHELRSNGMSAGKALDLAIKLVLGNTQRSTKPPPVKPGKRSIRTPAIASEKTKTYKNIEDELEQRIKANPDNFAKILAEINQRLGAGSLG